MPTGVVGGRGLTGSSERACRLAGDMIVHINETPYVVFIMALVGSAKTPAPLDIFPQELITHTQLYSPSKAATIKKQTKQRKRSEINHCKISQTQQDNIIQYKA